MNNGDEPSVSCTHKNKQAPRHTIHFSFAHTRACTMSQGRCCACHCPTPPNSPTTYPCLIHGSVCRQQSTNNLHVSFLSRNEQRRRSIGLQHRSFKKIRSPPSTIWIVVHVALPCPLPYLYLVHSRACSQQRPHDLNVPVLTCHEQRRGSVGHLLSAAHHRMTVTA